MRTSSSSRHETRRVRGATEEEQRLQSRRVEALTDQQMTDENALILYTQALMRHRDLQKAGTKVIMRHAQVITYDYKEIYVRVRMRIKVKVARK